MKLKLFEFIDETLALRNEYIGILENIAEDLEDFFRKHFSGEESFSFITHRVKTEESLKEKIIRNNLYVIYDEPYDALMGLSDLIGLRIEARFIKDEAYIYNKIMELFKIQAEEGYYRSVDSPYILLKLSDKQPQVQKNGFEIYKIDGTYQYYKSSFKFELQIKALVNVFWSEIDHKILYKNYSYMLTENVFRDVLYSIKDNLQMIDRQLMLMYDHVSALENSPSVVEKRQLRDIVSKLIHDFFNNKIKDKFGFLINLRDITDIIVEYLFMKYKVDEDSSDGKIFIRFINRLKELEDVELKFGEEIHFTDVPIFYDNFSSIIGSMVLGNINDDFYWNLIFSILFQFEKKDITEIYEDFIHFIRYKYNVVLLKGLSSSRFDPEDKKIAIDYILNIVVENFRKDRDMEYLLITALNTLEYELIGILKNVSSLEQFDNIISKLERELANEKRGIDE